MGEGEIDRFDAIRVSLRVPRAVRAANGMRGSLSELSFQGSQECLEEIEDEGLGSVHEVAHLVVDQGREYDRTSAGTGGLVDPSDAGFRLGRSVDEGDGNVMEFDALELGQQAVSEHFHGDAGAVRHEENSS